MKTNKKMYYAGALLLAGQMIFASLPAMATNAEDEGLGYLLPQYEQELELQEELQQQYEENMPGDQDEEILSENEEELSPEEQLQMEENFLQGDDQFAQYEDEQPLYEPDEQQMSENEDYPREQENQ